MCCTVEDVHPDTEVEGSTPEQRLVRLPTSVPMRWVAIEGSPETEMTLSFELVPDQLQNTTGVPCGIGVGCANGLVMRVLLTLESADGTVAGTVAGTFWDMESPLGLAVNTDFVSADLTSAFAEQTYVDPDGEPFVPEFLYFEVGLHPDTDEIVSAQLTDREIEVVLAEWSGA